MRVGEREEAVRLKDEWVAVVERERAAHAGELAAHAGELAARARELRDREAQHNEDLKQRDQDIVVGRERNVQLRAELAARVGDLVSRDAELAAARSLNRRTEESVTWQAFQRARGRLYGAIGDTSLLARTLRLSLRLAGRLLIKRPKSQAPPAAEGPGAGQGPVSDLDVISLPEYESPKVSLIIPLYARADLTRACLESIRDNTTRVSYEVILVEDDADEPTKLLLEQVRGARIVHNEQNLGYIRSVKRGAGLARGRWLVLCNNDIEVRGGWLTAMLACAESAEDVGVVTPKYLYPDGSLNEAGGIIWRDGTGVNYGRGDRPEHFQYEYRRETDYGSAAALMVSGRPVEGRRGL